MPLVGRARILTQYGDHSDLHEARGFGGMLVVCTARRGEPPEEQPGAPSAVPRGRGQPVMVVDDDEGLLELTTRALLEWGYEPIGFGSAQAALEAFRATPDDFAVLLTDLRMPGMSGDVLIREVRIVRPSLPVILLSGEVRDVVHDDSSSDLADEMLSKPLVVTALAASLARVLGIA